jgi:hypothetical protein
VRVNPSNHDHVFDRYEEEVPQTFCDHLVVVVPSERAAIPEQAFNIEPLKYSFEKGNVGDPHRSIEKKR